MYAEVVDETCDLIELQGMSVVDTKQFLEYVILHVHVPSNEEDDVLDQAHAQNGEVVLEEHVQVLVRRVDEELVREDVQLHAHGPRWLLAVALQHAETAGVHDPQASLQLCLLYTSPSPRDGLLSRMPSSA